MADFQKICLGTGFLILGYVYAATSQYIIPPIIDLLSDTLGGIAWFGVIITWFIALIILPLGTTVYGLITKDPAENPVFGISIAVLWSLFTLALSYFMWYWVPHLVDSLLYSTLIASFWIGIVLMWVTNVIIIPTYLIIEAKGD